MSVAPPALRGGVTVVFLTPVDGSPGDPGAAPPPPPVTPALTEASSVRPRARLSPLLARDVWRSLSSCFVSCSPCNLQHSYAYRYLRYLDLCAVAAAVSSSPHGAGKNGSRRRRGSAGVTARAGTRVNKRGRDGAGGGRGEKVQVVEPGRRTATALWHWCTSSEHRVARQVRATFLSLALFQTPARDCLRASGQVAPESSMCIALAMRGDAQASRASKKSGHAVKPGSRARW